MNKNKLFILSASLVAVAAVLVLAFTMTGKSDEAPTLEKEGGMRFVLAFDTDDQTVNLSKEEFEQAKESCLAIIATRLEQAGITCEKIKTVEPNRVEFDLADVEESNAERVSKLLECRGDLGFWETWDAYEVVSDLVALDAALASNQLDEEESKKPESAEATEAPEASTNFTDLIAAAGLITETAAVAEETDSEEVQIKQHPLLTKLALYQQNYGCIVGVAKKSDINYIDSLLNTKEAKQLLHDDLKLRWGVKGRGMSAEANIFELYALKVTTSNKRAPLEGDVITSANDKFRDGRPVVSMTMNSNGARKWAHLTEKNIGHSIAIVLDDRVYSAPNVNDKITGGRIEISGNFTVEDTHDLVNILQSGKLPIPVRIISMDLIRPKR